MRLVFYVSLHLLILSFTFVYGSNTYKKHHIVYMGKISKLEATAVISANKALLASVGEKELEAIHHYSKSFRGFSAMLTHEQARQLQDKEEVISVFESRTHSIHTTHSWDFLGLDQRLSLKPGSIQLESDVIIGSIDTGVWPESESFNDNGLGPVPRRFKGACITGDNFTLANCNKKIIGARYYFKGFEAEHGPLQLSAKPFFRSPRDADGHGSHTASTAAGAPVLNAAFLGNISTGPLARGGAPGARLAIYKACWFNLCNDADLLSAFDDAIQDGVDIISISVGPSPPQPAFFGDSISIGSFHAFVNRILVSASAGNSGLPGTAANVAPWILTVAASSVDRRFGASVLLGNSKTLRGTCLNPTSLEGTYGIVPGGVAAAPDVPSTNASFCQNNTLNPAVVTGKIVICTIEMITDDRPKKAHEVRRAGGVGMILVDPVAIDLAFEFAIPTALIGLPETRILQAYLTTDSNPVGTISQTFIVDNIEHAPEMAVFSSAGPSTLTPDIIKPDITAPGINILAAWSPVALVNTEEGRSVNYNIISGTSMSCPHVTGAAAFVRSRHRIWSPAALKSALMTTATVTDKDNQGPILRYPNGSPTTPFDFGSGHLNPTPAISPGLVYDYDVSDMLNFLCSNGATTLQLRNLTGTRVSCNKRNTQTYNLNYPSIAVANVRGNMSVYRMVTNCHDGNWVYNLTVDNPVGVTVGVVPDVLRFSRAGEKKRYRVDIVPLQTTNGTFVFGAITWRDGFHRVRSPIALNIVSL